MPQLELVIRSLPDGRFYVRYSYGYFGRNHREYFDDKDSLNAFVTKMLNNNRW